MRLVLLLAAALLTLLASSKYVKGLQASRITRRFVGLLSCAVLSSAPRAAVAEALENVCSGSKGWAGGFVLPAHGGCPAHCPAARLPPLAPNDQALTSMKSHRRYLWKFP